MDLYCMCLKYFSAVARIIKVSCLLLNFVAFILYSVPPSTSCGPFTEYKTAYSIVIELVNSLKVEHTWLHTIIKVISGSGFIAGALLVLL